MVYGANSSEGLIYTAVDLTILRRLFEGKGFTTEATNWFNVVIDSHAHMNRCKAYDHGQRHPATDAWAGSSTAEVPGHVVRHDSCAARSRQLPEPESRRRLL